MTDFDKTIFNIKIASGVPHPGSLLVAEPFLRDVHFMHSVVCMVDCDSAASSMGIVMNRPTGYTLQGLLEDVKRPDEITVWCGGPMSCDRLYFLHMLGPLIPNSREISPGLFIGGDFNAMIDYVNSGCPIDGCIRFFVGYSGWSPGQLDEELMNHVWAVVDNPDMNTLMTGGNDSYWHRQVRALGQRFRGWLYHPRNPRLN